MRTSSIFVDLALIFGFLPCSGRFLLECWSFKARPGRALDPCQILLATLSVAAASAAGNVARERLKKESAVKPGSVLDSHSSGIRVTAQLKRPTRKPMRT